MRNSEVVRQAVERAILSFDPIRTGETDIQVEVENGLVALSGYVRTSMMKNVASQLASKVLDGRQLRNDLISDDDLEIAVAGAIEVVSDSYLAPVPIQVRALRGHCVLRGTVPSEGAKEEIERLAYRVPGVLEVANSLQVDPATIERLVAPKKATAGKRRGGGGVAGTATVGGKPVTAADLPEWALKAKEDWSRADYQARAKAKMAFKRNEGPDPKELEQAGAVLRGGSAGAAVEEADVDVAPAAPAAAVEDAPAPAATSVPAASPPAPIVAVAEVPDLPSWAFRAKEQWSKEEFQAYARAKSAFKKGEGPDPDALIAQGQAAAPPARAAGNGSAAGSPPAPPAADAAPAAPAQAAAPAPAAPKVDMAALQAKYPSWALKAKEEWTPDEFKAQAKAKSAFKKGEGPDPVVLIAEAQAALNAAKAAPAQAAASAAPQNSAEAALAAVRAQYPGWALKPRREWSAQDFREAAEAKVAEIRAKGQPVNGIRSEAQAALEAAKRGEVAAGAGARAAKRDLTPEEIAELRARLATEYPAWALKPKEEWTPDEFKAQAQAKSAAKRGEGADPKVIIEQAQAALESAKAEALRTLPAAQPAVTAGPAPASSGVTVAPAPAPAGVPVGATAPAAREISADLLARYPGWALRPKEQWSPDDFKAHAKAKSAFKKGEGPDPDALTAEAQAALGA